MTDRSSTFDLRHPPPPPAGMGRGAMLALLVHVGLLIALAFGVNWRSSEPAGLSAELWAAVPQVAAPAAAEPPPPPPVALPKPLPAPKAPPKIEAPLPPKPETRDADIAIEKARLAEKEKREREERERLEQLERERLAKLEREKAEKLAREKAEQLEREKAEKLAREKAEKAEKLAKAEEAARLKRLDEQRRQNLERIMGQAGATGAPQSTGTALRDAGPSANYAGRIVARVRPNIVLTETVPATLRAEVEVRAAPDGTIISRRLTRSSGNSTWDEAVLRAIDRTETLPKDDNGRVPSSILIEFRPT